MTSAMEVMKEKCRFWDNRSHQAHGMGRSLHSFTSAQVYINIFQESVWALELPKLEHWELHNLRILTITNA